MELVYGLLAGGVGGAISGYLLATHIHSIAAKAAVDATTAINNAAASIGTVAPTPSK